MVRLACFVLFAAVFIQADATWNFNLDWSDVSSDEDSHWLGQCVWSWLRKLIHQGYECDQSGTYPRVTIAQNYLGKPSKDPVLAAVLQQLKCNQIKGLKYNSQTIQCGNGWVKSGRYCICYGQVNCTNPTTATTTKATTTPAPTTTTTKATTTPTAGTTLAQTTPGNLDFAPTFTSGSVPAGSVASLQGRQPFTLTFTVAAKPAPSSVTLSRGTFTVTLSGSALSSPANTYQYTYTFAAVDSSDVGLWTATANNGVGSPATYQFSINLPVEDISVTGSGNNAVQPIQPSGLVAFQAFTCNQIVLGLVPGTSSYSATDYDSSVYAQLYFDAFNPFFNLFNSGNDAQYTLPNSDCPVNGEVSTTPFWIMLLVNPTAGNPGSYDVMIWTSPDNVYSPSSPTPASAVTFSTGPLQYNIAQIVFDTNGGVSLQYINYPNAV